MPQNMSFFALTKKKVHGFQVKAKKGLNNCLELLETHPCYSLSIFNAVAGLCMLAGAESCNNENSNCEDVTIAILRVWGLMFIAVGAVNFVYGSPEEIQESPSLHEEDNDEEVRLSFD